MARDTKCKLESIEVTRLTPASTVEVTLHTVRRRKRGTLIRNVIPSIRNLILTITVRENLTISPSTRYGPA